jgi:hypothetical protein
MHHGPGGSQLRVYSRQAKHVPQEVDLDDRVRLFGQQAPAKGLDFVCREHAVS